MILRDPVHGLISFSGPNAALLVQLIDAPEIQRLRRIRALGLASLAFPGGEHSRFAHAIGAAHVMRLYLDRVSALEDELAERERIDEEHAAVALAAALLHDAGHGPFSHTFEDLVPHAPPHEEWTSRILLDPETTVHRVLHELDPQAPARVERLVHGQSDIAHLARAVSGTFDVDRCDYLMRDSYMTGVRYGLLDVEWLMASLRLYTPGPGEPARLAVDGAKGLTAVEGFFMARLYMYRQVYLHKAVRAAEVLMSALFRRLAELGPEPGTPTAITAMLEGSEIETKAYLALDDHSLEHALATYTHSKDPVLRDLATRLRDRRLPKTMFVRPDLDPGFVRERLVAAVGKAGSAATHLCEVDRVEVEAYAEDESMLVVHASGTVDRLLDASPLLRGLSREAFVHQRAVFPAEVREVVRRELADLT